MQELFSEISQEFQNQGRKPQFELYIYSIKSVHIQKDFFSEVKLSNWVKSKENP